MEKTTLDLIREQSRDAILITLDVVARLLNTTPKSIRNRICENRGQWRTFPRRKISHRWLIPIDELAAWLDSLPSGES